MLINGIGLRVRFVMMLFTLSHALNLHALMKFAGQLVKRESKQANRFLNFLDASGSLTAHFVKSTDHPMSITENTIAVVNPCIA
jgi:hypothetical protein